METYIALLRGINVSGKRIIKMEDLRKHLTTINLTDVKTYIQSGNVIFKSQNTDQIELAKLITVKIEKEYGFNVPVIVLNQQELKYISENNQFIIERNEDITKLAVTFLSEEADAEKSKALYNLNDQPNEFIVKGKAIYLYCPNGFSNSKLTINFIESKLKLTASSRNWNTVLKLLDF